MKTYLKIAGAFGLATAVALYRWWLASTLQTIQPGDAIARFLELLPIPAHTTATTWSLGCAGALILLGALAYSVSGYLRRRSSSGVTFIDIVPGIQGAPYMPSFRPDSLPSIPRSRP